MEKEKYKNKESSNSSKLRQELNHMHYEIRYIDINTALQYDRVTNYCWTRHQMITNKEKTRYDNPLYYGIRDILLHEDYRIEVEMEGSVQPLELLALCLFSSSLLSEKTLYIRKKLVNKRTFYIGGEDNCQAVSMDLEKRIIDFANHMSECKTRTEYSGHRLLWLSLLELRAALMERGRWELPYCTIFYLKSNRVSSTQQQSKTARLLNIAMDITAGRIEEYQFLYRESIARILQSDEEDQQFYTIRTAISLQGLLKHNIELKLQYIKDGVWPGKSYGNELSQMALDFIENISLLDPVIFAALIGKIVPSVWGLLENVGTLYFRDMISAIHDGGDKTAASKIRRHLMKLNELMESWMKVAARSSECSDSTHGQDFLWSTGSFLHSIEKKLFRNEQRSSEILAGLLTNFKKTYYSKPTVKSSYVSQTFCSIKKNN